MNTPWQYSLSWWKHRGDDVFAQIHHMMMTQALLSFKLDYFAYKSQEKYYPWDLNSACAMTTKLDWGYFHHQNVRVSKETNTQPVYTSHRVHVSTHWRQNYHQYKDHALQIVGNGVSGQLSTFFVCREIWSLSVHRFFAGYSIPGMQAGTTGIYDKCFAALDN